MLIQAKTTITISRRIQPAWRLPRMIGNIAVARPGQSLRRRASITRETAGLAIPIRFHRDSKPYSEMRLSVEKVPWEVVILKGRDDATLARGVRTVPK